MKTYKINNKTIIIKHGDITRENVDAIVNAANSGLRGGGGVDGAIHAAGGPEIMKDCRKIISKIKRLPTGEAVRTTAGDLPARYVIHTVGPVYKDGRHNEPELLRNAYINSLKLATDLESVAFPAISTGVYGYPLEEAAKISLQTIKHYLETNSSPKKVIMILFMKELYDIYLRYAEEILAG